MIRLSQESCIYSRMRHTFAKSFFILVVFLARDSNNCGRKQRGRKNSFHSQARRWINITAEESVVWKQETASCCCCCCNSAETVHFERRIGGLLGSWIIRNGIIPCIEKYVIRDETRNFQRIYRNSFFFFSPFLFFSPRLRFMKFSGETFYQSILSPTIYSWFSGTRSISYKARTVARFTILDSVYAATGFLSLSSSSPPFHGCHNVYAFIFLQSASNERGIFTEKSSHAT